MIYGSAVYGGAIYDSVVYSSAVYSRNSADSTVYHTSEICIIILLQKQFHTIVHSGLEGEKEICISAASDLAL